MASPVEIRKTIPQRPNRGVPAAVDVVRVRVWPRSLFVPQCFDGIETSGLDGREHSADDANKSENQGGGDQRGGIDGQMNVSLAGVFDESAPQGERADRPRN